MRPGSRATSPREQRLGLGVASRAGERPRAIARGVGGGARAALRRVRRGRARLVACRGQRRRERRGDRARTGASAAAKRSAPSLAVVARARSACRVLVIEHAALERVLARRRPAHAPRGRAPPRREFALGRFGVPALDQRAEIARGSPRSSPVRCGTARARARPEPRRTPGAPRGARARLSSSSCTAYAASSSAAGTT